MPIHGYCQIVEGERWFLVQSLPKSERKAQWHLGAQGFRTFLPQFERSVRHARRSRLVRAPLFPGYIFVALDLCRDRWLSIRSTVGVARLHTHRDGSPVAVPRGIVETLLSQSEDELVRLDDGLSAGQAVRILSGPFADRIGNLKMFSAAQRVQVLLQMMGGAVPVTLKRSMLAPVISCERAESAPTSRFG